MWEDGLLLEIKIARIIQEQEEVGVLFNKGKAVWLLRDLENKKEDLYKTIRPYLQYDLVIQETKLKDKEEYSYVKKLRRSVRRPTTGNLPFACLETLHGAARANRVRVWLRW